MQPVETHNTTKDITQEELRGFHVNSKNNQQNRKVNEELIQRAWHKELLTQMVVAQDERPPVISDETYERLQDLLEFRHAFNNIYGRKIVYEKTEQHALNIGVLFGRFLKELDTFIAYLKKQEND